MSDDESNDYERQRLANIAANEALLKSLGIEAGSSTALGIPAKRAAPSAPVKREKKKPRATPSEIAPRRASSRLQGIQADSEVLRIKEEEEDKERAAMREAKRRATHGPYTLDNLPEPIPEADLERLSSTLAGAAHTDRAVAPAKLSGSDAKAAAKGVAELRHAFKQCHIGRFAKVTADRVFSMTVHPDPAKTLVFVGDKTGSLGIWDALAPADEHGGDDGDQVDDDDEDDSEGKHWSLQAHGRSSISCIRVSPSDNKKLLTSSYDCTVRMLDLATQASTEVFSVNDTDSLLTSFDLTPTGHEMWVTDKHGGLSHADLREKPAGKARRWEAGEGNKLGAVSINPALPHLLVTAGNDRNVRIWDARLLQAMPRPANSVLSSVTADDDSTPRTFPMGSVSSDDVVEFADSKKGKGVLRGMYKHGKSCSSAYWDPWGGRVLTTSYDDNLRVWDITKSAFDQQRPLKDTEFGDPTIAIPHDCQTGRWLSILRAQWSQYTQHGGFFTVGSMRRSLDVFSASGEPIARLFDPELITAVPAVTAAHPSIVNHVIGGNGSGKCALWMPKDSTDDVKEEAP